MRPTRPLLPVALAAALAWCPSASLAQSAPGPEEAAREQARALLKQGNELLDKGNYLEALQRFEAAYAAFPSPKLLFNIAQTCMELGRTLEALERYERFVRDTSEADNPAQWALAHQQIFALQGQIATVLVQSKLPDVLVIADGVEVGRTPLPAPLRLLPGPHVLVASKAGYESQVVQLKLSPGQAVTERLALLTEEEGAATRKAVQEAEARRRAAQESLARTELAARVERAERRRGLRIGGWTGVAAGAFFALGGAGLGIASEVQAARVRSVPDGTQWTAVRASATRADGYRTAALASGLSGAALLVAGAALLAAVGPTEAADVTVAPAAGPAGAGLSVAGTF